eukprot:1160837-Pelagomonas_calceolata.AAC.8
MSPSSNPPGQTQDSASPRKPAPHCAARIAPIAATAQHGTAGQPAQITMCRTSWIGHAACPNMPALDMLNEQCILTSTYHSALCLILADEGRKRANQSQAGVLHSMPGTTEASTLNTLLRCS